MFPAFSLQFIIDSCRLVWQAFIDRLKAEKMTHALVLPDQNFLDWFQATKKYVEFFKSVAVVRSPKGMNLNRYKTISAVKTKGVWFNDDPVAHIRRAYPSVVTVDVLDAPTPAQLATLLNGRVTSQQRFGTELNQDTRFTLDWATESSTLRIVRPFDLALGNGFFHEGMDIAAELETCVICAVAGEVITLVYKEDGLGYGAYIQVGTVHGRDRYLTTYTNLQNIVVQRGQQLQVGDPIGECASDAGIKLVVQKARHDTGNRYKMPGAVDPLPLIYVEGLTLQTTATFGLRIRRGPGVDFPKVGDFNNDQVARPLEPHGVAIVKLQSNATDNLWVNLVTQKGVSGFGAAWFLTAKSPRSKVPRSFAINGVNLDLLSAAGKPNPNQLGKMQYVRLLYNVSMGTGSQDLNRAHSLYEPYLRACASAGKKVILVYTHQTYGEGAGYVWERMDSAKWNELGQRFAEFVRSIAARYAGRGWIAAHQIWNEQDAHEGAVASVRMNALEYANLLFKTISAIRTVDPSTPIITGGHTGGPQRGANYARATLSALPSSVRPDGLAFHPYGRGPVVGTNFTIFGHIEEEIQAYWSALPNKRMWITEWGVLDQPNASISSVSDYAKGFIQYLQARHPEKIAALIWYAWADSMHNGYGLVNEANVPKEPLYSLYTSTA